MVLKPFPVYLHGACVMCWALRYKLLEVACFFFFSSLCSWIWCKEEKKMEEECLRWTPEKLKECTLSVQPDQTSSAVHCSFTPTWSPAILCNSALNGSTVVYTCCLKVLHFRNYKKYSAYFRQRLSVFCLRF